MDKMGQVGVGIDSEVLGLLNSDKKRKLVSGLPLIKLSPRSTSTDATTCRALEMQSTVHKVPAIQ